MRLRIALLIGDGIMSANDFDLELDRT